MGNMKKKVLSIMLGSAAKTTGRSRRDIEADLRAARRQFGISTADYFFKGMYKLSLDEIKAKYFDPQKQKTDLDVELVAEIKGISYEAALSEMDALKNKYGILYKEYTANKLYVYKTKKGLKKKIAHMAEKDEKYLGEVCADAGWSYEKAKSEAERVKKRFGITYKYFSRYHFYTMSDDEISAKLRHWTENARHYIDIVMKESGWSRMQVRRHMKRYGVLYDILQPYYVLYRAWELSDEEMDSYARQKLSERLWARYNDAEQARILAEKHRFDEVYAEFTGRKFWINRDSSFEQFCDFAEGIDYIFCKPIESGGGLGTEKLKVTEDLRGLYDTLMSKERLLVEECIKQHEAVDEFIPGCVCTVRVVVIQDEGQTHTICAGMRFGHHGITDNFSQDGMVADIDVDTGVIITDAVDKKGHVYEKHPVSGKVFKGFKVPNWDRVRYITENAMNVLPGINYVGWDVAICPDGAVLVEGNAMPDLVLIQAPHAAEKKGMRYLFDPWLNKEK